MNWWSYGILIVAVQFFFETHCRTAPSSHRPKTKPDDLGCRSTCTGCQSLHPPSPFIIIKFILWNVPHELQEIKPFTLLQFAGICMGFVTFSYIGSGMCIGPNWYGLSTVRLAACPGGTRQGKLMGGPSFQNTMRAQVLGAYTVLMPLSVIGCVRLMCRCIWWDASSNAAALYARRTRLYQRFQHLRNPSSSGLTGPWRTATEWPADSWGKTAHYTAGLACQCDDEPS